MQYRVMRLIKGLRDKYLEIGSCVILDDAAARPFLETGSLVPADPDVPPSPPEESPAPESNATDTAPETGSTQEARKRGRPPASKGAQPGRSGKSRAKP